MNNFDDLFVSKKEKKEKQTYRHYDKDEWVARKRQERSDAFALLDEATKAMMTDPEKFRDYMNVQGYFDRYSVSNAILIAHQKPDATHIADFATWKENDVSVNKGEKAFTILEPGNEFTREDGSTGFSVNVKKVFDISQTSEAENATPRKLPEDRRIIEALIAVSPCDIRVTDELPDEVDAHYVKDEDIIYIRQGMDGDRIFLNLTQEIAVAKVGRDTPHSAFIGYCVSYQLCERYGFNTENYSFDGVEKYFENKEPKAFRSELDLIREVANDISQDVNRQIEVKEKSNRSRDDEAR